jgi:hypothetical protein
MTTHFHMGAINKITNAYEYPKIANKINKYKCPSCEQDVIFKKGQINKPHFAHYKSDNPCYYYDKPNESQVHKDAKLLMKTLLDNKKYISINGNCNHCADRHYGNNFGWEFDIFEEDYNENTKAVTEHKFYYNNSNRSADVALIEGDAIKYIFEICYKNKTKEENRPEPWFEIDAEDLINKVNTGEAIDKDGNITIECIRRFKCDECVEYDNKIIERQIYYEKLRQEQIVRERQEQLVREKQEKEREMQRQEWMKQEQERQSRETIKRKEQDRIIKEEEERLSQLCKCGITIKNICLCNKPTYELVTLSNNWFCKSCNKWKDRC